MRSLLWKIVLRSDALAKQDNLPKDPEPDPEPETKAAEGGQQVLVAA